MRRDHGPACTGRASSRRAASLAAAVGPFAGYDENREPMLHVMEMHRDAGRGDRSGLPGVSAGRGPRSLGRSAWPAAAATAIRNAQATVLAPTGTIAS